MVKFTIQFQNKRVGSTFLQNAIDSHPDLAGVDEVFVNMAIKPGIRKSGFVPYLRSDVDTPEEYIEDIIKRTHWDKKAVSMKLMYNQIGYHSGLLQYIKDNKIPIIHLMRKNLVEQVISFLKMAEYNDNPVVISGKNLLDAVEEAKRLNKYWAKQLKDNIVLTLYYEDIIGNTEKGKTYMATEANMKICNFFNVKYQRLFATTKKKNKKDMSIYLPNIEDVRKVFKNTEFEWML